MFIIPSDNILVLVLHFHLPNESNFIGNTFQNICW